MHRLNENQLREIGETLRDQGKIAAVKLYKDWTNCSLLEAKNAVEAIEQDGMMVPASVTEPRHADGSDLDSALAAVDKAIAEGKKLNAVKLYRELSGKSLRDSKLFVESRMNRMKPADSAIESKRSGCFSAILLLTTLASGSAIAVCWQLQ